MADSAAEKRHPPSQRKLKKARERGEAAVSRELAGALAGLAAVCAPAAAWRPATSRLLDFARDCFSGESAPGSPAAWRAATEEVIEWTMLIGVPAAALAFLSLMFQTGLGFRLRIDFSRLHPARGLKKIFSRERMLDVLHSFLKMSLLILVGVGAVAGFLAGLPRAAAGSHVLAPVCAKAIVRLVAFLSAGALAGGIFDYWLQRRRHLRRMRMSRRELIEEHKEQEGDPRQRAERRRLHRQLSQGVGLPAIRAARLVVVNPTHIAVALAYRQERDQAPWVVVSGWGSRAQSIRQAAERSNIPVLQQVELARGLVMLEWGEEIPEEHYQAVADIVCAVEQVEGAGPARSGGPVS